MDGVDLEWQEFWCPDIEYLQSYFILKILQTIYVQWQIKKILSLDTIDLIRIQKRNLCQLFLGSMVLLLYLCLRNSQYVDSAFVYQKWIAPKFLPTMKWAYCRAIDIGRRTVNHYWHMYVMCILYWGKEFWYKSTSGGQSQDRCIRAWIACDVLTEQGTISLTFTIYRMMGIFAMRSKSNSQSLRNRIFYRKNLRRVINLQCVQTSRKVRMGWQDNMHRNV